MNAEEYEPFRFDGGVIVVADLNNPDNGDGSIYAQGTLRTDRIANYGMIPSTIAITGGITVSSTSDSTSISSGSLVVQGGIGIGKSLSLGKGLQLQLQTTVPSNPTIGKVIYLDPTTSELRSIDQLGSITSFQPKFSFEPTQNKGIVSTTYTTIGSFVVRSNTNVVGSSLVGHMLEKISSSLLNTNFRFQYRIFDYSNHIVIAESGFITGNFPVVTTLSFTASTTTDIIWEIQVKCTDQSLVKSIQVTQISLLIK